MFEDRNKQDQENRIELSQLGEFGLIDHLTKRFKVKNASTIYGIGDDAAILDAEGKKIVLSTDLLVEGVHFDLSYVPLKHLGYKSTIVNLSDICAMNAYPTQITVSLAVSNRFPVQALEELYEGIRLACEQYNVDLVGGDTTSSQKGLIISVSVLGYANEERIVKRNTAKEGDLLCVTGDLGSAYLGLLILEREKAAFMGNPDMQPELEGLDYLLERQLKPEARMDVVKILEEKEIVPTSMIDISDGLASEIIHICSQSKVGCSVYENKIPVEQLTYDTARTFNMDPTTAAMNGGEDYELLFTVKQDDYDKIKDIPEISIIGHITDQNAGRMLVSEGNVQTEITAQGFDHMKAEKEEEKK